MADDAMRKNQSLGAVLLVRLVIVMGAAVLYLRGLLTPGRRDKA
jgi:hypothetical protein